jgi:hypothetical protein
MRFLVYFLLIVPVAAISQEVLPGIDWSNAGIVPVEDNKISFNFSEELSKSGLSEDELMSKLIKENPEGATIFFPKGEYHFKSQIRLTSGFVLKGEGSGYTKLIFDLEKEQSAIYVSGQSSGQHIKLSHPMGKGEKEAHFVTNDPSQYPLIDVGEYVMLADADGDLVESAWAKRKTGQIVKVIRVGMEGIELEDAAHRTYNMSNTPMLVKVKMVTDVGIEKLAIENKTKTDQQTSNIHFNYASNCWVNGVSSRKSNYSHILLEFSSHCEVRNCDIMDAHDFGNGGKGYGITLQFATSACLIMGNRLQKLRHAILLQAGANGNVIRANKSSLPRWDGVMLPKGSAGDIVLHGNYPYANLIENNLCQNLVIDNSHGCNGPDNVLFRNDIQGYGLIMNRKSVVGKIFIINNVISNDKGIRGRYRVKGEVYQQYNSVRGKIKPKGSKKLDKDLLWK